jgi:hypothetical protein
MSEPTFSRPYGSAMTVDQPALRAVAELHHRYLTGTILALVHRAGTDRAAEVVRRTFRRQHLEKFLPGLEKLGLRDLPDAVACAQYHYLSNALGGVKVEWIDESDTKSWVRYLPPRWIWDGVAVCAVPTEVNRAMLWGWHAHNGVTLGNDRLGFVATSLTTDGGVGLVGYYVEEDRALAPEERLRFSPGEQPPGPAGELPTVSWDAERLAKVERNYAMDYVRSMLPELCAVLGPADAVHVGRLAGRQIGMQYHDDVVAGLGMADAPLVDVLARLAAAMGEEVTLEGGAVFTSGWRLAGGEAWPPAAFDAWHGLWEGFAALHGSGATLDGRRLGAGFEWRVR